MPRPHGALLLAGAMLIACDGAIEGAASGIELGTATISWSVAGSREPAACTRYDAVNLHIVVHDTADVVRAERVVPCSSFATAIEVRAGLYGVSATFEDAAGERSSATARVGAFVVEVDEDTDVELPFTHEMMVVDKTALTSRR